MIHHRTWLVFSVTIAALAAGCGGAQAAPAQHAKASEAGGAGGAGSQPADDGPEETTEAYTITGVNPLTDLDPQCKKSVDLLPDGSVPIVESQEQLDALLGCQTQLAVDWAHEHLYPITLQGINKAWRFQGLSTESGVTTITIQSETMNRGAAMHVQEFWLVRIPATTKSVAVQWTSVPMPTDAPLYP